MKPTTISVFRFNWGFVAGFLASLMSKSYWVSVKGWETIFYLLGMSLLFGIATNLLGWINRKSS
ncbi:MAG: hypothetical protein Q7S64_00270 [bacterium]|nr:hypothetical protein [bacterium]